MDTHTLRNLVGIGEALASMRRPTDHSWHEYCSRVSHFISLAKAVKLDGTVAAACSLDAIRDPRDEDGTILPEYAKTLADRVLAISYVLANEADNRQFAMLRTSDVSPALRDLPSRCKLTQAQEELRLETIRCIEVEAYRSAIVMAWNLCYDYVRHWMHRDSTRLAGFNAELTKGNRRSPIGEYTEFWTSSSAPNEFDVLMAMTSAGLLPKVSERLTTALKHRNTYAHSNSVQATASKATSYIEDAIDIMVRFA